MFGKENLKASSRQVQVIIGTTIIRFGTNMWATFDYLEMYFYTSETICEAKSHPCETKS